MKQILLVSTCREKLHELEFVKPFEDILNNERIGFFVKNYKLVSKQDLEKCSKVIICGTSLKDFDYVNNLSRFGWIKYFEKPLLGICAGMQVVGLIFGGKKKRKTEIGFYKEKFDKNFLGIKNLQEVYHLHNSYIDFSRLNEFQVYSKNGKISQAVKHRKKEIYCTLFHPEVRNKQLILEFVNNG